MRAAIVSRRTAETDVSVSLALDGMGKATISTGVGFLDHMLELLARHALFDIEIQVTGDLHVDHHHTTEDTGIALGQAFLKALGDKKRIARYADIHLPMDEALTRVALDISGRPFLVFRSAFPAAKIGAFDTELVRDGETPLYVVAHVEDITQRRETERALREAEERFRRAFEDSPIGMALVATDGQFLRVNHTLCEITGFSEEELLERTFQEITHPDDLAEDVGQAKLAIDGDRAVVVRAGDAGGVSATLNGRERGVLGLRGWPLTVSITPEGIAPLTPTRPEP